MRSTVSIFSAVNTVNPANAVNRVKKTAAAKRPGRLLRANDRPVSHGESR